MSLVIVCFHFLLLRLLEQRIRLLCIFISSYLVITVLSNNQPIKETLKKTFFLLLILLLDTIKSVGNVCQYSFLDCHTQLMLLRTDPVKKCPHSHKEFAKKFQKIVSIQGKGRLKIQLFKI